CMRQAAPDDGVFAVEAVARIREIRGSATASVHTRRAAQQLCKELAEFAAAGNCPPMSAIGGKNDVDRLIESGDSADRDGLLPNAEVHRSGNVTSHAKVAHLLFEEANPPHQTEVLDLAVNHVIHSSCSYMCCVCHRELSPASKNSTAPPGPTPTTRRSSWNSVTSTSSSRSSSG